MGMTLWLGSTVVENSPEGVVAPFLHMLLPVTTPLFVCRFGPPRIMSVYDIGVGAAVGAPALLPPGAGFPPASFTARAHLSC